MREQTSELRQRRRPAVGASWTGAAWGRALAIATAAAVFLAVAGAFGTAQAGLGARLAYWLVLMPLGTVIAWAFIEATLRVPPLAGRPLAQTAAMTLGMGLIYTLVVWAVSPVLLGPSADARITHYLGPVMVLSLVMGGLNLMASRPPLETHAGAVGAPAPRFLERLPPKLRGGALYAVEAEDHYLRLHTDRGSDLILLRLADAIAELDGLEGAQTHRSWWVAKAAVESVRRDGGRARLELKSGVEAPVSRTYLRTLREEGWF